MVVYSRLEAVAVFVHRSVLRESVLALLRRCSDLERMVQKVSVMDLPTHSSYHVIVTCRYPSVPLPVLTYWQ